MSAPIPTAALAFVACLALAASAAAQEAPAKKTDSPVKAQVLVVLGMTEGEGVDPALAELPALSKPPFDSFVQKKLLSKNDVLLAGEAPGEIDLPNGRTLRLSVLGRDDRGRYRVQVSINRPGKKDYLPVMTVVAAPGDPFFVAGQKYKQGTLIIGVRVGQPKK